MTSRNRTFIYLASQSARRKEYLRRLQIPFKVISSDFEEFAPKRGNPQKLALRNACGKAAYARIPKRKKTGRREFIIGADTVVSFCGQILGKPENAAHAQRTLIELSGKTHWVYTALVLVDCDSGRVWKGVDKTRVRFRQWDKKKIRAYVQTVKPLDKAAGYAIQHVPRIVERYWGSRSNVVGMPLELLKKLLRKAG